MGAGSSTFVVVLIWALPIVVALVLMRRHYQSPTEEELKKADEVAKKPRS